VCHKNLIRWNGSGEGTRDRVTAAGYRSAHHSSDLQKTMHQKPMETRMRFPELRFEKNQKVKKRTKDKEDAKKELL